MKTLLFVLLACVSLASPVVDVGNHWDSWELNQPTQTYESISFVSGNIPLFFPSGPVAPILVGEPEPPVDPPVIVIPPGEPPVIYEPPRPMGMHDGGNEHEPPKNQVPEPATYMLVLSGILLVFSLTKRQKML